jgi:DNA processing protein
LDFSTEGINQRGINESYFKSMLGFLLKNDISVLNISDESYPNLLKEIYFPPPILFFKGGKIRKTKFSIAVVGTRKCTAYGAETAKYISRQLSKIGITIVSGMALGIDSYAHKAALEEKGSSIGVLGCGIDIVYPPENKYLYNDITKNGSLVSEFFPGTPPLRANFPSRNRIISGISNGVVVIQAGERSGAIITSEIALKQNREVFAVPGSIFNSESRGCHRLIKSGAKLVEDIDDILEEFSQYFGALCEIAKEEKLNAGISKYKDSKVIKGSNDIDNGLGDDYKKVYEFVGYEPKSLEEIIKFTGYEIKKVLGILASLELKQLVEEKSFGKYKKIL